MVPEEMEANDTDEVVKVPSGKGLGTDKTGTDSVEQELESGEKGFASDIVEHQSFKSAWKIGINTVFAQKLVMLDVVALECHGVRDTDRDVGNDGKTLVGPDRFQCEVVGDFVNGEKDVLVGCASDNVGGKEHGEGEGMVRLEIKRERQLEAEDGKDKRKGDGSRTHELSDFWVRFQYSNTPGPVGLFCGHPEKVWVRVDERLFRGRCLRAGAGLFGHVEFPV